MVLKRSDKVDPTPSTTKFSVEEEMPPSSTEEDIAKAKEKLGEIKPVTNINIDLPQQLIDIVGLIGLVGKEELTTDDIAERSRLLKKYKGQVQFNKNELIDFLLKTSQELETPTIVPSSSPSVPEADANPIDRENKLPLSQEASFDEVFPSRTSQAARETKEAHSPTPVTSSPLDLKTAQSQPNEVHQTPTSPQPVTSSEVQEPNPTPKHSANYPLPNNEHKTRLSDLKNFSKYIELANNIRTLILVVQKPQHDLTEKDKIFIRLFEAQMKGNSIELHQLKNQLQKLEMMIQSVQPNYQIPLRNNPVIMLQKFQEEITTQQKLNDILEMITLAKAKSQRALSDEEISKMVQIANQHDIYGKIPLSVENLERIASKLRKQLEDEALEARFAAIVNETPKDSRKKQPEVEEKRPQSLNTPPTKPATQKTTQPVIKARLHGDDLEPIIKAYDEKYKIKGTENYQEGYKKPQPSQDKTTLCFPGEKEAIDFFIIQVKDNPDLKFTVVDEKTNLVIAYSNGDGILYNGKEMPYQKSDIKFESSDKTLENFNMPENENQKNLGMS